MSNEREPERRELTPELAALEGRLAGLSPVAARIDRDKLMFEAGRAAAQLEGLGDLAEPSRLGVRLWPAATVIMTAASVLLATMLVWQREDTQIATQPMAPPPVPVAAQPQAMPPAARLEFAWSSSQDRQQPNTGYLGMRHVALTRGVHAIDSSFLSHSHEGGPSEKSDASQRRMLNELLPGNRFDLMPRS